MDNERIDRRAFLKSTVRIAAVGAIGILAVKDLDLKSISAVKAEHLSKISKVINLADFPALQSVGGHAMITSSVIVIRTAAKKFIAIKTVCTHKKCDVDYTGSGFECPCHGSTFNKSGKVLTGPAKKNLTSYSTKFNEADNTLTINM